MSWNDGWNEGAQSTQEQNVLSLLNNNYTPDEISTGLDIPKAIVYKIYNKKT